MHEPQLGRLVTQYLRNFILILLVGLVANWLTDGALLGM